MSIEDINNYMATLRQSGRTARMVEEAKQLLQSQGGMIDICIIASDHTQAKNIEEQLKPIISIEVIPIDNFEHFDWVMMRPMFVAPNKIYYIDHSVIEKKLSLAMNLLHRFDN